MASSVNHQVPASDFSPAPGDRRVSLTGERPVYKQHRSLPISSSTLLYMALYSRASGKHKHSIP
ncbi:unnamed protein product [Staurois parvus]|uniref:Uncharacterized protein n=1 Tax=Staurois parvus TaxID=386267 RepID=A0ABN9FHW8_9NEOB|nr:unnamed protein product [Staurois parvus]